VTVKEERPPPIGKGWRFLFVLWALAFAALMLYEVGGFLWKTIRSLF
jgi:hypothetical protein